MVKINVKNNSWSLVSEAEALLCEAEMRRTGFSWNTTHTQFFEKTNKKRINPNVFHRLCAKVNLIFMFSNPARSVK